MTAVYILFIVMIFLFGLFINLKPKCWIAVHQWEKSGADRDYYTAVVYTALTLCVALLGLITGCAMLGVISGIVRQV